MTLHEKVVKELGFGMNVSNETDIAFGALWVSRRSNGDLTSTWMHLEEEEVTDELRAQIANVLRNLAESICPTQRALDGAKAPRKSKRIAGSPHR